MLRPSSLDGVQGSLGTFAAVEIKRGALVVKETGDCSRVESGRVLLDKMLMSSR